MKFLENENNCTSAMKYIPKAETLLNFFLPLLPKEKLASYMESDDKICKHIIENLGKVPVFHKICKELQGANINARIVKKIRSAITADENLLAAFQKDEIDPVEDGSVQPKSSKSKSK